MSNQKLLDYIKDCSSQGFSSDKISDALIAAGWSKEEIKDGFSIVHKKNEEKKEEIKSDIKDKKGKKKKEKKTVLKYIFIIVPLILILSGMALAYNYYFLTSSFERNISRSLNALAKVNSFSYESAVKLDIDISKSDNEFLMNVLDKNEGYILLNINGDVDLEKEYSLARMFLGLQMNLFNETFNVGFDAKTINNMFYLKVKNLPKDLGVEIDEEIFSQWIKFNIDELDNTDYKEVYSQENIDDIFEIILDNLDISELFIVLDEKEIVYNEKAIYYYHLALNYQSMPGFLINTYKDIYEKKVDLRKILFDKEMAQEDWQKLREEIEEEMTDLELTSFKLWIDKESYLPQKLSTDIKFVGKNLGIDANLKIELIFTSFNQDLNIEAPKEASSYEELMKANLNLSDSSENLRDKQRLADIQQIQVALEDYYFFASKYPEELIAGGSLKYNGNVLLDPIPTAPSLADCLNNDYIYTIYSDHSYCLRYCLSSDTGNILAGDPIYATESTINAGSACPHKIEADDDYETETEPEIDENNFVYDDIIESSIIIFYMDTCPYCDALRDYISANNLDEKISFTMSDDMDQLIDLSFDCKQPIEELAVPFLWDEGTCLMSKPDIVNYLNQRLGG